MKDSCRDGQVLFFLISLLCVHSFIYTQNVAQCMYNLSFRILHNILFIGSLRYSVHKLFCFIIIILCTDILTTLPWIHILKLYHRVGQEVSQEVWHNAQYADLSWHGIAFTHKSDRSFWSNPLLVPFRFTLFCKHTKSILQHTFVEAPAYKHGYTCICTWPSIDPKRVHVFFNAVKAV